MKFNHILGFGFLAFAAVTNTCANQQNKTIDKHTDESETADFLEFLADVEEASGDGFDNWIKADSANCETNTLTQTNGLDCQEKP